MSQPRSRSRLCLVLVGLVGFAAVTAAHGAELKDVQAQADELRFGIKVLNELTKFLSTTRTDVKGHCQMGGRYIESLGKLEAYMAADVTIAPNPREFAKALDLSAEDPRTVERYTAPKPGDAAKGGSVTSEDEKSARKMILVRRLLEAGARCVSVSFSDFDTHSKNFPRMRYLVPIVDHAICTFVTDLEERGMLDDVSIVIWGEFGRTPKVNKNGGRDHWPQVSPVMLAGGGMRTGQVIGATDRIAAEATERPMTFQEVFATLYHNLGIDLASTTVDDPSGRPHYLLDHVEPIRELL